MIRERQEQARIERLYSEENLQKLDELFRTVENELENFISTWKDSDLQDFSEPIHITFATDDEISRGLYGSVPSGRNRIVFSANNIVQDGSTDFLLEYFSINMELRNIVDDINKSELFRSISIFETHMADLWVSFTIHPEQTPFFEKFHDVRSVFYYIDEGDEDWEPGGMVRIKDNWFVQFMERE